MPTFSSLCSLTLEVMCTAASQSCCCALPACRGVHLTLCVKINFSPSSCFVKCSCHGKKTNNQYMVKENLSRCLQMGLLPILRALTIRQLGLCVPASQCSCDIMVLWTTLSTVLSPECPSTGGPSLSLSVMHCACNLSAREADAWGTTGQTHVPAW